ncbi:aspartyl/asparaginyl beta-hydroxylase (cupin superfamily) [Roseovarius sp. MBR-154]|jgi:beta-hydroxylase
MEDVKPSRPEKPKSLNRPVRRFVKRNGKKAMRWASRFQSKQSLVPDTPFLDTRHFPFLDEFEQKWEVIRDEVREILKNRDDIPGFEELSPDQYRIAQDRQWKTFVLYGFGEQLPKNTRQAQVTTELLSRVPNVQTAWFSILAPGYHIPAHTGVTKGILRAHLGLIIPQEREKCRIRVDDEVQAWETGKVIVLDDTYEHEVWNDTDEERVILLFDFDRPMGWRGRMLNRFMLWLMKFTAFYQEPKKNLASFEDRFEAATRRADANLEKLSD